METDLFPGDQGVRQSELSDPAFLKVIKQMQNAKNCVAAGQTHLGK